MCYSQSPLSSTLGRSLAQDAATGLLHQQKSVARNVVRVGLKNRIPFITLLMMISSILWSISNEQVADRCISSVITKA